MVALAVVLVVFSVTVGAAQILGGINSVRAASIEQLADNNLRLAGDVELHVGAMQFRADLVDIFIDESRLVASGNVVITSPDADRFLANRIVTDVLEGQSRLVLSGGVVIVSTGGLRITADRMELDKATGTLHSEAIEVVVAANQ